VRVSRAQATENHQTIIAVASCLFRRHGFDGIGLKQLMKGAGLTPGGFYKKFKSKDDLVVQACAKALASGASVWSNVVKQATGDPLKAIVRFYLSDRHRHEIAEGCALAALGADAARSTRVLRRTFENGIRTHLTVVDEALRSSGKKIDDKPIVILSTMVGALILSRVVEDQALSKKFLDAASNHLIAQTRETGASQKRLQ
jgi:TetR/AcrR family transcriptional repressor of nem operon